MNYPWFDEILTAPGVKIDSRQIKPGEIFIALPGERDGHDFIPQAKALGAAAVIVTQKPKLDIPYYLVSDTREALIALGKFQRDKFNIPMIALTGSSGKTTVKSMITAILSEVGKTFYTPGNFNTNIGVPLSLLSLDSSHQFAVVELGANHIGEIAELVKLVRPNIALINNIGTAHIGEFGSIENIAKAKAEIFSHLKPNDTAIFDITRDFSGPYKSYRFGLGNIANYQLIANNTIKTPEGVWQFDLNLLGQHNQLNAVAAIAVTSVLGLTPEQQRTGLAKVQPIPGRLECKQGRAGATIIDDTYNASLPAMQAALDVLASFPGNKIFIMGDMAELGDYTKAHHQAVINYAKKLNINKIYTQGPQSQQAGGEPYVSPKTIKLDVNTTVLVKGSRGMKMEEIVKQLLD